MGRTRMDAINQASSQLALPALLAREADHEAPENLGPSGSHQGFALASQLASRRRQQHQRLPLVRTIADEVVPLLVLAHRESSYADNCHDGITSSDGVSNAVRLMAEIVVRSDVAAAVTLIEELHAAGAPLDALYLEVIAGAAKHLGQMWHDDTASFADVTIGVLALQRLLHVLDHAFCAEVTRRDPKRRILLAARPGEPHGFALDMLSAFLRRACWDVACFAPRDEQGLCAALRGGWYAVLGISDSCGSNADELAGLIHVARRASRNRYLRVMLGGPAFSADPERAIRAGADATAVDARHAVLQAEGLFALARGEG